MSSVNVSASQLHHGNNRQKCSGDEEDGGGGGGRGGGAAPPLRSEALHVTLSDLFSLS